MTLAAPRSRQGKVTLVLAILAAFVAIGGSLLWYQEDASAQLPLVINTDLDQNPDGPANINLGTLVTYTSTAELTAPLPNAADDLVIEIYSGGATPGNTLFPNTTCSGAGVGGPNGFGDGYSCVWAAPVAAGVYTTTFSGEAAGTMNVPTSEICAVTPGTTDCAGQSFPDAQFISDTDGDMGTLTANDPVTVEDATNFPGAPHTFQFNLGPLVTCDSDPDIGVINDGDRECDASDVVIGGSAGCSLVSVVVLETDLTLAGIVEVTIDGGAGVEGDCTVSLDTIFVNDSEEDPTGDIDFEPVVATKTFSTAEAAGEIRHHDLPDPASEDAAGTTDNWCDGVNGGAAGIAGEPTDGPCGILLSSEDNDDAVTSFHGACIINGALTFADAGFISWQIVPVSGNPLPTPVSITEYEGPNGEPCVRWSTAFTGTQNITATYDNGVGPVITFYWDGYCVEGAGCVAVDDDDITGDEDDADVVPTPLVKEWNEIEETRIVVASGVVGDTLAENTLDLADWVDRDCSFFPAAPGVGNLGFCDDPNVDGLTLQQESAFIINTPLGILISAAPRSFIDYTMGGHSDAGGTYDGPVDGAEQTYSWSGDCGSVRLENPATGDVIILNAGNPSETVLSSDKGVGFTIVPTDDGELTVTLDNADCGPLAQVCVTISTVEDNPQFVSPPALEEIIEEICVEYTVGPPTDKTPILAWAGQRVILEHYWGNADGTCPELDFPNGSEDEFGVLYSKQNGPGSFTAALQSNGFNDVDQSSENVIVDVDLEPTDSDEDGVIDANSGCISRVIFESEDEGQVDVSAYVVDDNDDLNDADPRTQQVAFVIYYMKFEDLSLGIVPGARQNHNSGSFVPANPIDPSTDVLDEEANVSADVLVRARVRGWVETTNCPARDSGVGQNGEFLPANRCIFPDDWRFKAGGNLAEETRPNFDVLNTPPTPPLPGQAGCAADPRAAGPFSLLDTNVQGDVTANVCGDSLAPNVDPGHPCLFAIGYSCRETVFPNGTIDMYDANMPPALLTFNLTGSGFLHGADKDDIYTSNSNLFYATHIPAEPYIAPINFDLSGYSWNSWGGAGAKSGQYDFWNDLADFGTEIFSCPGASPCGAAGVATGGYALTRVYTDNHGEAMTWVNGDANLTFDECDTSAGGAGNNIVLLNGFYCEAGEVVGDSTISAYVDYPDKRKHFAIEADNDVTITWTWGGIKSVTIVPGENGQFNYVVLHVTDRDGFCTGPSLHPVLGEAVNFTIDSPEGIIFPDVNGNPAALLGTWTPKTANVTTFQADDTANGVFDKFNDPIADGGISVLPLEQSDPDECQAWIHVSESQNLPVNVVITAHDPEGTVTFDVLINPPTPTPAPVTPSPTPANQQNLWADIDCSDNVDPVDSLKVLRHDAGLSISQTDPCPDGGEEVFVQWDAGQQSDELWGDADCNNSVDPVDSLKILRYDAGLFYLNQQPCPAISEEVLIPAQ